ncbi:MAG: hypothetical protein JXA64_07690 [Candidatus Fermentibacteraceae bacterium]|nr:hypothetical protein [Candidatus Fermentibacteraceae bacterium]MBN2608980.1 hypothetical protein [Candidatus Fermentibacteraceae bacterium]
MGILRTSLILFPALLLMAPALLADPVDSARDLLYAVEYGHGDSFLELLSESVRGQVESAYRQLQDIAAEDPGLAETMLQRTGSGLTTWDLEWMTTEDFVSVLLRSVQLPSLEEVISEKVSMYGRNAEVVMTWLSGYSVTFQFIWESSSWKVTGSSLLDQLF